MLLFNLILQPHKFDNENFEKNKEPLYTNLKIVGSVYYHLIKTVIKDYLERERDPEIFELGNWLRVPK